MAGGARDSFDLIVIGGGINGAGIAADAAGRGLTVLLAEQGDLAGATSSASSKLIHGGLRYLEHYEFRLVREALAEREVLLARAPHIIWPLRFVLPHVQGLRPRWMIRAGLMLYDNLSRRRRIPASASLDFRTDPAGRALKGGLAHGFAYWDCWVDDARLVVCNAMSAARNGAEICVGTRVTGAAREEGRWRVMLAGPAGPRVVRAGALVNAAGPWVEEVARRCLGAAGGRNVPRLRLVKGSHIIVPRIRNAECAYLLQSPDRRVVFAIPYEERFTLVGTTDVPFTGDPGAVEISDTEQTYLLELLARFFPEVPTRADIVWRYAGVRALNDDESADPSAVTRDWHLELDVPGGGAAGGGAPLMNVIGGKVTTHRRLAEAALARLAPHLPAMGPAWTASTALPGGEIRGGDFEGYLLELNARYSGLDPGFLRRIARRHGSETPRVLGDARTMSDLGLALGAGLYEREVDYLARDEWARAPDDILWRRTKAGLHMSAAERTTATGAIERMLARVSS